MPVEKRSHNTSNSSLPYIFSPANSNKPAPLVLFLHGAKDRGTDINVLLKKWGFPLFVDSSPSLPYVFVAPQLPQGQTWVGRAEDVIALLDHIIATQPVDPSCVIISGFSLGTAGAWHIAASYPGRFAGLVATSGRVPQTLEAAQIAALQEISIQIFQGAKDEKLSIEDTQNVVNTLRKVGAKVDFTVLPGDHFIANEVYSNPILQQWLVSQSRRQAAVAV